MKSVILIIFIFFSSQIFAKTINLDPYFSKCFNKKDYKKCYELCKIYNNYLYNQNHKQNYNKSTFKEFGIVWKSENEYISDSIHFFEFKSLYEIDKNLFYYNFAIKNEIVIKYFDKNEIYPVFVKWADSLYHTPIANNYKIEIYRKSWLIGVYKYIKNTDTTDFNKIFKLDNNDLVNLLKRRTEKDLLNLPSIEFNLRQCIIYGSPKASNFQEELNMHFVNLFSKKRFLTLEQVEKYLFEKTNLTKEEKMVVAYYLTKNLLIYRNPSEEFCAEGKIERMILYREAICEGYATLLVKLLNDSGIYAWKIHLEVDIEQWG